MNEAMNISNASAATRDVPRAMAELAQSITDLEMSVESVYNSSSPACSPELPEPNSPDGNAKDASSNAPLADEIASLSRRIVRQSNKLKKLQSRLQL